MSIYKSAVEKPITTLMIFVAILVLGVFSYIQLPVDLMPKMDPPYITVMATYPGANATDIEENVTKILEDRLNTVDDLKELTSKSYENLAVVTLEFEWEANLDSRESQGGVTVKEYLGDTKEHSVVYANSYINEHPEVDYVIFGHRHLAFETTLNNGAKYINLGDWLTQFTYAELDQSGNLALKNYPLQ